MKIRIEKRYMLIPVGTEAQRKKLLLRDEAGTIRVELDARLSAAPDYRLPYDLRDYIGQEMTLSTEPAVDFQPVFVDQADDTGLYREKLRPAAHFTAPRGWINDPNGFVYYEGRYHLFYQHNPADTVWGNMHWGHAVSRDLVHWEDRGEALFQDEHGAMYSGSAVIDERNLTGLQRNEHAPLLLFYTAAGGSGRMNESAPFTQRLAYSTDGGETFVKYPRAILPHIAECNRDPKIVWCDELECYVMALYLRGREFALYRSENLLDWTAFQRLCLEDDDECPDFYPLECGGERYWVLTAAHDHYLIGRFERGLFQPVQSPGMLHAGRSYAAQSCFGLANKRRVRFGWNRSNIPNMPFNGSMTTPQEMTLRRVGGAMKLCAYPAAEFDALRGEGRVGRDSLTLTGRANDIELTMPAEDGKTATLFGLTIAYADGKLTANGEKLRVRPENGLLRLRIVQDVHAVEVYVNGGEATMLIEHRSDLFLNRVECAGAEIAAWPLENIWG